MDTRVFIGSIAAVMVLQLVVIRPVQAVVNVALTILPTVVGGGALLTCSWTNLANLKTVEYKLSSTNDVVYTYDTASNTKVGSGILSGSVGWMEMDTFIVYVNVTIQSQFVTYLCHVTNDTNSYESLPTTLTVGVPVTFLTMETAVVGAGSLITCSWQYLPSAMTFVLITDTTGQLDYQFDLEMGDNRGMGLLTDTVGWLGDDTFYVYINKTEKKQMSTYTCFVGTGDDTIQSDATEFIVNDAVTTTSTTTTTIPTTSATTTPTTTTTTPTTATIPTTTTISPITISITTTTPTSTATTQSTTTSSPATTIAPTTNSTTEVTTPITRTTTPTTTISTSIAPATTISTSTSTTHTATTTSPTVTTTIQQTITAAPETTTGAAPTTAKQTANSTKITATPSSTITTPTTTTTTTTTTKTTAKPTTTSTTSTTNATNSTTSSTIPTITTTTHNITTTTQNITTTTPSTLTTTTNTTPLRSTPTTASTTSTTTTRPTTRTTAKKITMPRTLPSAKPKQSTTSAHVPVNTTGSGTNGTNGHTGGDGNGSGIGFPAWSIVACTIGGGAVVSGVTYLLYDQLVKKHITVDPLV